jgi:hypothetical protein
MGWIHYLWLILLVFSLMSFITLTWRYELWNFDGEGRAYVDVKLSSAITETNPVKNSLIDGLNSRASSSDQMEVSMKSQNGDLNHVIEQSSVIKGGIKDQRQEMDDLNVAQKSKYAYVTLISGIDSSFRYRGFLYNAMIMRRALLDFGSQADFVAMIGYSNVSEKMLYRDDINLLHEVGIITHTLPRLVHTQHSLTFAEMALLKITPWSFLHYDRIQFFDGDIMPMKNMDCFFKLQYNTFTVGAVSPLNSGWYLAIPNKNDFKYMLDKAMWRLSRDWDKIRGWSEKLPSSLTVRGGHPASKLWDFNGADMDQGLLLHYFIINHGNGVLIDTSTKEAKIASIGGISRNQLTKDHAIKVLKCCQGHLPVSMFAHFTGRSKPWMIYDDLKGKADQRQKRLNRADVKEWFRLLDSIQHLTKVNSTTIATLKLASPLGFWNHNFPKGGMKTVRRID